MEPFQSLLSESRLHPSADCRAWTAAEGCRSSIAWDRAIGELPFPRAAVEEARLAVSNALSTPGIDPLGVFRSLLVHESAAPMPRQWLREAGFVHLDAASGIHLYCAWRACASLLRRGEGRGPFHRRLTDLARAFLPPALWAGIWSLSGFRPGLVRPLLLLGVRAIAERRGWRLPRFAGIAVALAVDAFLGFALAYGRPGEIGDWAPGELHYALSWWGGVLAAESARGRGWGRWKTHLALSLGSWAAVLPVDLFEGRVSLATPVLSFLTVELLAAGGYALVLATAVGTACGMPGAQAALRWESAVLNQAVGFTADFLSRVAGLRKINL
jgi:hypothetical protein